MTPRSRTVEICVCTFRRMHLAETLRSISRLNLPSGFRAKVLVVDNDGDESARQVVYALAAELDCSMRYVHAPAANISIARNACLDVAKADFLAFIDDDETVREDWLTRLLETADAEQADVVLGPVRARYSEGAPRWMSKGDFHSTMPVWVQGTIRTGYTCNVLLRMAAPSIAGRRFDLSRGQTGGEDTEFFSAVHQAGGRIAYAPLAWAEEGVPDHRSTFGWLAQRRFRSGQTHGGLLRSRTTRLGIVVEFTLACAKSAYCFVAALATIASPITRNRNLLRAVLHAGVVAGLAGMRELRLYGEVPNAEPKRDTVEVGSRARGF